MKRRIAAVAVSAGLMLGAGAIGGPSADAQSLPAAPTTVAEACQLAQQQLHRVPPKFQPLAQRLLSRYCAGV